MGCNCAQLFAGNAQHCPVMGGSEAQLGEDRGFNGHGLVLGAIMMWGLCQDGLQ